MTLCLQLLIRYSRRMEVSQRDKYFNDSVNNVTYRLNGYRVTFLAWNVHVELQPPMIPLFGYKTEGLFIWWWVTPGRWRNPPSRGRKIKRVYMQSYNPEVVVALAIKEFEQRCPKFTSRKRRKINSWTYMYLFMKASRVASRGVWLRKEPLI